MDKLALRFRGERCDFAESCQMPAVFQCVTSWNYTATDTKKKFQLNSSVCQGGSGIRMPDQMLVGWLPPGAQKKKKGHHQNFCPWRPILALMIIEVQLYTAGGSKADKYVNEE